MDDRRPDPDALLAQVQAEEPRRVRRGRLKIFFGAAPGVGKTYAMLEAARRATADGADILVGYVEPHARPETHALTFGLELLPRRHVEYRGTTFEEFDLEGAIARRPAIVVLDELAHTNAPDSTHAKRWQDVEALLAAGIDVFTTLNVQHLESLNDIIARITGVVVRETVPDTIFDQAHEVELVDLPPDDLLLRLREGKVYVPQQAARAVDNFFRKGNLIALRELALRRTAERVGAQVQDYRQAHAIARTWPTAERLLVCVGPSPMSAQLVRAARRMAASLRAPWTALHVESSGGAELGPRAKERLYQHLRLAEQLGAQTATVSGARVAEEVIRYAQRHNVTKIIVGKPREPRWKELIRGSFVYELTRKSGDIDVYVITGDRQTDLVEPAQPVERPVKRTPYAWAIAVVLLCTGLGLLTMGSLAPVNLVMVYLLGVVVVSLRYGQGPSVLASVLSVAAFDFFFVPPSLTFAVADSQYLLTFAVMLGTGLVISRLTARVAAQAEKAQAREERTAALYALSRGLSSAANADDVVATSVPAIRAACGAEIAMLLPTGTGLAAHPAGFVPTEHDSSVANWVQQNGRPAGRGTGTLPGAGALYVPLSDAGEVHGVLGVRPTDTAALQDPEYLRLIESLAGHASVALGRVRYAQEASRVRLEVETERVRNALLSAVSHDLRTPLAAIAGASSTLLEDDGVLPPATRRELLETVVEESAGLNRLIGNLLEATRLEGGAITLHKDWQSLEELVGAVYGRLATALKSHSVSTSLPADLPLFSADGALIQQVLQNLLENAAKYSPSGTPIEVRAGVEGGMLVVEVADRGPGITAGEEEHIFAKFHRSTPSAGRPGVGLGLAIARGIVNLHGGRIWVENRAGGGAVFRFSLPCAASAPERPVEGEQ